MESSLPTIYDQLFAFISKRFVLPGVNDDDSGREFNARFAASNYVKIRDAVKLRPVSILNGKYRVTGEMTPFSIRVRHQVNDVGGENNSNNCPTPIKCVRIKIGQLTLHVSKPRHEGCEERHDSALTKNEDVENNLHNTLTIPVEKRTTDWAKLRDSFGDEIWHDEKDGSTAGIITLSPTQENTNTQKEEKRHSCPSTDESGRNEEKKAPDAVLENETDGKKDDDDYHDDANGWWLTSFLPPLEIEVTSIKCVIHSDVEAEDRRRISIELLQNGLMCANQEDLSNEEAPHHKNSTFPSNQTTKPLFAISHADLIFQEINNNDDAGGFCISLYLVGAQGHLWHCDSMSFSGTLANVSFSGAGRVVQGTATRAGYALKVTNLETLKVNDVFHTEHVVESRIVYNGESVRWICNDIELFPPPERSKKSEHVIACWNAVSSFPVRFNARRARLHFYESKLDLTSVDVELSLFLPQQPSSSCVGSNECLKSTILAIHRIGIMDLNDWISVNNVACSGVINHTSAECSALRVTLGGVYFYLKKESKAWVENSISKSKTFCKEKKISAPFAKISSFPISIQKGKDAMTILPEQLTCPGIEADPDTSVASVFLHFCNVLKGGIKVFEERREEMQTQLTDTAAASAGMFVAGASMASPVGLAASVAAIGISDGVSAAVGRGKEVRGAAADANYKFGDLTRGTLSSVRSLGSGSSSRSNADHEETKDAGEKGSYLAKNKGRFCKAGGSSLGAAIGLCVVGGPVGLIGGSVIGGTAAAKKFKSSAAELSTGDTESNRMELLENDGNSNTSGGECTVQTETSSIHSDYVYLERPSSSLGSIGHESSTHRTTHGYPSSQSVHGSAKTADRDDAGADHSEERQYKFGDLTRGIISRGKKADHRDENSSYKFGDFTRGLLRGNQ